MVIFDDRFVDENVCSGLSVEPAHRQNLHEVVIGSQGVALNRRLQELVQQIEEHNANLRIRAEAIPEATRGPLSIDDFCDLPAIDEIDRQIQLAERDLAAAQRQNAVRDTGGFDMLMIPTFDAPALTRTLELALPNLEADALNQVQTHFRDIGRGGEMWVADGMSRIVHTDAGKDICPFCTQDMAQSDVIGHYREYFSEAYAQLKERIANALAEVNRLHPRELPARLERNVRVAADRRHFWSSFIDVPEIDLDSERLMRAWQASRDGVVALLDAKQASPLDRIEVPDTVRTALDNFAAERITVEALNERLERANAAI